MKGNRLTPVGTEAASYGYPTLPDPALRRSPLAEPQGYARGQTRDCNTCPDRAPCARSVSRCGMFANPECEAAIERKPSNPDRPLTALQTQVLEAINAHPAGLRAIDVARVTGLQKQTCSYTLYSLARREMIVADDSSATRRIYRPLFPEKGTE